VVQFKELTRQKVYCGKGRLMMRSPDETDCKLKQAENFCVYLEKHRHRIVNYQYYQAEQICSIGSGSIESTVKQIDRRTKISGAQWKIENVPQVIAHRCAYLNGLIFAR
jgi:hypothetical protein